MNALIIFAALCCAVGASAQVLPNWLPQMVPYPCTWCSGRYYRRSPQYLTTANAAVGSPASQSRDVAAHAGYFYDIIPKTPVKTEKAACIYLVNMYRAPKTGPVAADQIMSYINMTFFGPQQNKDYSDKPHPLAFQCCHYKFGRQLMDVIDVVDTNEDVTSVTSVTSVTTDQPIVTSTDNVVVTSTDNVDVTTDVSTHKRRTHSDRKGRIVKLGSRTVIPNDASTTIVGIDGDEYRARMPEILPEGYDCNMLTRQLYMELSQNNNVRQKQIQKAMSRTTSRVRAAGRSDSKQEDEDEK